MRKHLWTIGIIIVTALLPVAHAATWSNPLQITNGSITHTQPVISQDGTKIVYIANPSPFKTFQIFAVNFNGTGTRQITNNTGSNFAPSVSGNGTVIVYYSNIAGGYQVFRVRSDGTGLTALTSMPNTVNTNPVISADGSRIVFASNQTGMMELYSMYSNGSKITRLTTDNGVHGRPTISSDGKLIAFASNNTTAGNREIFLVYSNGSSLHQLTTTPGDNFFPVLSGNGKLVAFESNSTGHYEISIIGTDGSGERTLTSDTADDKSPTINYDGTEVGYTFNSSRIVVTNTVTGEFDALTATQDGNVAPTIDGGGKRLGYLGNVAGFNQLFAVSQVSGTVGGQTTPTDKLGPLTPFVIIATTALTISVALNCVRVRRNSRYSDEPIHGTQFGETPNSCCQTSCGQALDRRA